MALCPRGLNLAHTRHVSFPSVDNPARITALRRTGLLDSDAEEVFDRLTRLAVRLVGIPAAFISLVDVNRDFYKSACGFGEPLATARELTGPTFCHHTVQQTTPLVIPDTAGDPRYRDVPTVKTLGIAAYVGVPLVIDSEVIGAFCAIDMKPHRWTKDEVEVLVELAASAQREIKLRGALKDAREAARAAELARDEAERARAEAATANRVKGEFLAVMSHELRTPLNAIGGYSDLIEMGVHGPVTEGQLGAIDRIKRSQKHLLGLINGLLVYAQIDAGAVTYDLDEVNVDEMVDSARVLISPQLEGKTIRFTHNRGASRAIAIADRDKLGQIIINLLSNAVKFSDSDGSIEVTSEIGEGRMVQIAFTDTGCGISFDQLERIFQPFVQVDTKLTRAKEGTGLGLSISRNLARGMGGDITVLSRPGEGSVFVLTLPLAGGNQAEPQRISDATPHPR